MSVLKSADYYNRLRFDTEPLSHLLSEGENMRKDQPHISAATARRWNGSINDT